MNMKHYTISVCEKAPRGAFLRYEGIDAESKSDLKKKVEAWNAASKTEYMALRTAFVLS